MASAKPDMIDVQNIGQPGKTYRRERVRYEAVRDAVLAVLSVRAQGLTFAEIKAAILPQLPDALFPDGATVGWWLKTVQLDLEAKGVIQREAVTPLRLRKV